LPGPREPDSAATSGFPIVNRVRDDLETDAPEQFGIFVGAQAGVIERVASILTELDSTLIAVIR
jgi:hypothetical protein